MTSQNNEICENCNHEKIYHEIDNTGRCFVCSQNHSSQIDVKKDELSTLKSSSGVPRSRMKKGDDEREAPQEAENQHPANIEPLKASRRNPATTRGGSLTSNNSPALPEDVKVKPNRDFGSNAPILSASGGSNSNDVITEKMIKKELDFYVKIGLLIKGKKGYIEPKWCNSLTKEQRREILKAISLALSESKKEIREKIKYYEKQIRDLRSLVKDEEKGTGDYLLASYQDIIEVLKELLI